MSTPRSVSAKGALPDHTQLPDKDGLPVRNDLEPLQSALLTECVTPALRRLHPDDHFWIGQDCGIYWRLPQPPEPLVRGALAPDWCCVLGVPPVPEGALYRRSYVLWQERVPPVLVVEYVSGDGSEERDRTPETGKFWIYEQRIRAPYYAIYEVEPGRVEVYRLVKGRYRRQRPNQRGHYPIKPLGLELGIWQGRYQGKDLPWLRWYDAQGQLLPTNEEQKEQALRQLEEERRKSQRLAERLRALGIDPDVG